MKLGRNDPCHCGSGQKYKKCHLPQDEAARAAERPVAAEAPPADAAPAEAPAASRAPTTPRPTETKVGGRAKLPAAPPPPPARRRAV